MIQGAQEQRQTRANDLRKQRLVAEDGKAPVARFLAPSDLEPNVLRAIFDDAIGIKVGRTDVRGSLTGKRVALLFQKTLVEDVVDEELVFGTCHARDHIPGPDGRRFSSPPK